MKYDKAFGERGMRQSTLAFVGMLALTMVGCGSDDSESSVTTESAPQPPAKVFEKPMANQFPSTISSVPVLIQPTNGNQRAKQVQKGRQDPFAGLFAQTSLSVPVGGATPGIVPQPSSPTVPRQTVAVGSGSSRPSRTTNTTSRQQSNPGRSNTGQSSGRSTSSPASSGSSSSSPASSGQSSPAQSSPPQSIPLPPVTPGSNFPPVAPPPPQEPDLASNVAVTGVIQIGEEPQAIVQVPNEGTSRYVRVGQRLSNGQVLVKRIEMNEGSDPIVILEQYGIEVARVVGEKPATAQTGTSTDGSQAPQSSPGVEGTETPGQTTTPGDGSTGTPGQITTPSDGSTGFPGQTTTPLDDGSAQPNSDTPAAPLDAGSAQPNSDTPAAPLDTGSTQPSNTTTTDSDSFPPLPENSPDTGAE